VFSSPRRPCGTSVHDVRAALSHLQRRRTRRRLLLRAAKLVRDRPVVDRGCGRQRRGGYAGDRAAARHELLAALVALDVGPVRWIRTDRSPIDRSGGAVGGSALPSPSCFATARRRVLNTIGPGVCPAIRRPEAGISLGSRTYGCHKLSRAAASELPALLPAPFATS